MWKKPLRNVFNKKFTFHLPRENTLLFQSLLDPYLNATFVAQEKVMKSPAKTQRILTRRVFLKYLLTHGATDFRHSIKDAIDPSLKTFLTEPHASFSDHLYHFGGEELRLVNPDGIEPSPFISERRTFLLVSAEISRLLLTKRLALLTHQTFFSQNNLPDSRSPKAIDP